jgi:hypothetical protein
MDNYTKEGKDLTKLESVAESPKKRLLVRFPPYLLEKIENVSSSLGISQA